MVLRLNARDAGFETAFQAFLETKRESSADVDADVAAIIADVRARGDAAAAEYTRRFDGFDAQPENLRVTDAEIDAAAGQVDPETLDALKLAAARIRAFHEKQIPENLDYTDDAGLRLGLRWTPVSAAGLYVPGGLAAYPSSALMNALPAKIAGVERLVMTVPAPGGALNPLVMAAARLAGVDEVWRLGGAQAIAALAYGTETLRPVDKIAGPGNAWVAAAKRRVFGQVGIDMIAGPSEVLILADGANDPAWIAADLLSQAEHDEAAQAVLMTDDSEFAKSVVRAVEDHLTTLPRAKTARASWENFGAVILVESLAAAAPLIDRIAPEHLQIPADNAEDLAGRVRNAGAVFLGRWAPEALGDYIAGPNHVLPTARSARFSSGLGVTDFMKRTSVIGCGAEGLAAVGPAAARLAEAEGLTAHALSISIRLNDGPDR
ncbi:MAG: histidinol dehydrogenase [Rhodospirillales bacterium]